MRPITLVESKERNRVGTHGSNSWITLSNLKTEKSLVEKAEEELGQTLNQHERNWEGGSDVRKRDTYRGQRP